MPYKSKRGETEAHKGRPAEEAGHSKAEVKTVNEDELEQDEALKEKYASEDGDPDPNKVYVTNRNRNTNKPSIDKPAYGGS